MGNGPVVLSLSHEVRREPASLFFIDEQLAGSFGREETWLSLPKTLFKLTRGLRRNQNIIAA
jgi:hypothetical protein